MSVLRSSAAAKDTHPDIPGALEGREGEGGMGGGGAPADHGRSARSSHHASLGPAAIGAGTACTWTRRRPRSHTPGHGRAAPGAAILAMDTPSPEPPSWPWTHRPRSRPWPLTRRRPFSPSRPPPPWPPHLRLHMDASPPWSRPPSHGRAALGADPAWPWTRRRPFSPSCPPCHGRQMLTAVGGRRSRALKEEEDNKRATCLFSVHLTSSCVVNGVGVN